ncbi:MAG: hypothetical protein KBD63_02710, partial [Bacteriovoracaceae bacterium]|nr:hypothetical protein [Bacteriovoracaceae bacterium]
MVVKGEFVLLISIQEEKAFSFQEEWQSLAREYLESKGTKTLSQLLGKILQENPKNIYAKLSKK